ncbi:conserved hypothetical protein [Theileria orientalis strain Shintoku]|uniref:Uncharacterized protein n=1 Tax=Theileria orientalis strain Shintoku TaxID=869250 RepID=J4CCP3_THEOR|nr:conserved hypothetical protein [Theileria orientalis strain Shintoku]BAM39742.1 conserved hypothetical protein [Theileria orientalis strain Shintoku]|eukprot:XP_009690043.1 conserved hypothetical protein [Theileria orientalis strain Shintoku]
MSDKGVGIKFKKLSEIYSVTINTTADLLVLSNKILEDTDTIVRSLNDIKDGDVPLENDFIKLVDILRNENESKPLKMSKKLAYLVMSECMTRNEVEFWKILISRMYLRGIREILVQALIKYLSNTVKENEEEEYKELRVLLNTEATRGICCKVLKYLAKFMYIEKVENEYIVCADNHKYYNMIRRTISIMTSSMVQGTNAEIGYTVFTLFHPYNHANVPCLIKFMMIDVFAEEVKIKLLLYMAVIYADARKTRMIHATVLAYLAACMARILRYTKLSPKHTAPNISSLVTKGITENLQTMDPMKRLSAMTVAEAYSVFLANNANTEEPIVLNFGKNWKTVTPVMMYLGAHKSRVIINPNFAKIKKELQAQQQRGRPRGNINSTIYQVVSEMERSRSIGERALFGAESQDEDESVREESIEEGSSEGEDEDQRVDESKRMSEDENEGEEDIESYEESDNDYRGEEGMEEDMREEEQEHEEVEVEEEEGTKRKGSKEGKAQRDNGEGENRIFLDYIFKEVPSIEAKTVEGRVKETWLKPPQHIVQCYERLLSKPARGDVDYENINEHELDRVEEETVENKILRVSQTLIWLPRVIRKNETILEKYAVPLSVALLKLKDLELYKEKLEEIARVHGSKVSEPERELIEVASKDPEDLILVSLVLMSFYSPYKVLRHYTEHMFDREVTVNSKLKMMLCIQYTLMGYLEQMDGEELMKKVLERGMRFKVESEERIERLETIRERKTEEEMELKLREGTMKMVKYKETKKKAGEDEEMEEETSESKESKEIKKKQWRPSKIMKQKYLETMMKLLLNSLRIYKKIREEEEDTTDEEVAATIVQTIGILIKMNEKEVENAEEIEEMVEYFSQIEGDLKFKDSVKLVEQALKTRQIEQIRIMK